MFDKFHHKTLVATLAALTAALGVGGIAIAQNSGPGATPSTAAPSTSVDQPESANDKPDAADEGDGDGETNDDGPAASAAAAQ